MCIIADRVLKKIKYEIELQDSPWLLLSLQLQVDPAHQVGLGVQGGRDLPLVQSHLLVPAIGQKQTKLNHGHYSIKPRCRGGVKKRNNIKGNTVSKISNFIYKKKRCDNLSIYYETWRGEAEHLLCGRPTSH